MRVIGFEDESKWRMSPSTRDSTV